MGLVPRDGPTNETLGSTCASIRFRAILAQKSARVNRSPFHRT